jgi:ribA/ribD-fused uncharacterized protein
MRAGTTPEGKKIVYFYSKGTAHGEFSNLYLADFKYKGRIWKSVEHAYQYAKFKAEYNDVAEWLMTAPRPSAVAIVGHGFNAYRKYVRDDWETFKVKLMRELVMEKFEQVPILRAMLLKTGVAVLVEDSPFDSFWGAGKDGKGTNMLGKILMETRKALAASSNGKPSIDSFIAGQSMVNDHAQRICPCCKQSIVLLDDGTFVWHNLPDGWEGKETRPGSGIYKPKTCAGSGRSSVVDGS